MFVRALAGIALSLASVGCARSTPPATAPTTAQVPAARQLQTNPAQPSGAPSAELLARWSPPSTPDVIGFADLGALLAKEVVSGLLPAATIAAQSYLSKASVDCVTQWLSSVRQVAGFASDTDSLVILTYESAALKTPFEQCIRTFAEVPHVELGSKIQAYAFDNALLVVEPHVVLLGNRTLVEASLASQGVARWEPAVSLGKDQQLVIAGRDRKEPLEYKGYLSVSDEQLVVHLDVTFPDAAAAKAVADQVSPTRIKRELPAENQQMSALHQLVADVWHVQQAGRSAAFEFKLTGSPPQIAERLGMVSALAVYSVRKYIASAKATEARVTLATIAKQLVVARPKKFTALPPVPAQFSAVAGKKYPSVSADWVKWQAVGFALTDPQYYQYRVDVGNQGKSAEVVAEGDIDGNGQRSRFSLSLQIDKKTGEIRVSPEIEEKDPLE